MVRSVENVHVLVWCQAYIHTKIVCMPGNHCKGCAVVRRLETLKCICMARGNRDTETRYIKWRALLPGADV